VSFVSLVWVRLARRIIFIRSAVGFLGFGRTFLLVTYWPIQRWRMVAATLCLSHQSALASCRPPCTQPRVPPLHHSRCLHIICQADRVWDRRRCAVCRFRPRGCLVLAMILRSSSAILHRPKLSYPSLPVSIRHLLRTLQVEIPCLRPPETDGEEGYVSCR